MPSSRLNGLISLLIVALATTLPAASATGPGDAPAGRPNEGDILDVALGALANIMQLPGAHEGPYPNGRAGLSMSTTSCNVGTVNAPWHAPMEEEHPFIAMQLYREMDGRLEQIGVSWVKHAFFALSENACGPCQHPTNGTELGVGCSDTYGIGNNSNVNYLGPREEIDPYTGSWSCEGSYFAGGEPDCVDRRPSLGPFNGVEHRLEVADGDLGIEGATYVYEAYYVVANDADKLNNIGSRECVTQWTGASWSISTPAANNPLVLGPAVQRWGEMHTWAPVGMTDGDVLLAVDVTDVGGGLWRYEYALYNFDSNRRIRSFTVSTGNAQSDAITFHDWDSDASNDWTHDTAADAVTWQTDTYETDPEANALSFGLLFNFGFTTNAPPVDAIAELGVFAPGVPARGEPTSIGVATRGPDKAVPVLPGFDGPGAVPAYARLGAPTPNPTGLGTSVPFALEHSARVGIAIFDASGRRVRTLTEGRRFSVGSHRVGWDGRDDDGDPVGAGVYFVRLRADGRPIGGRSVVVTR